METGFKPSIVTFQAAMKEYFEKKKVETVKCECCKTIIEIKPKGDSALEMHCKCGLYNDNLRGF